MHVKAAAPSHPAAAATAAAALRCCCCALCCIRWRAGKTTLLRYLLENSKEKVACIVNDVASINIDAKLVRNDRNRARSDQVNTTADLADTIELANGCACECSGSKQCFSFSCIRWPWTSCIPPDCTWNTKHARSELFSCSQLLQQSWLLSSIALCLFC
jgi:hypothetical protein